MKSILFLLITLTSFATFAQDATTTFSKIVSPGQYLGTDDAGNPCQVTVTSNTSFITVSIESELLFLTKTISTNSQFVTGRLGRQNVLFFQTEKTTNPSDDTIFTENSIKVVRALENKLSVTVGNSTTNNREVKNFISSCNI